MSDELYNCGICDKDIVIEYLDDIYSDDSGEYHADCHQEWADNEARYWSGLYYSDSSNQFKLTQQEQLDAYEPGSAKHYAMERELIGD
jgi:hypothetical protein